MNKADLPHTNILSAQHHHHCTQCVTAHLRGCGVAGKLLHCPDATVPTMLSSLCAAQRALRPPEYPKLANFWQPSSPHTGPLRFTCEGYKLSHVPRPM